MRLNRSDEAPYAGGDLTPMIDMTFQLIAFFMLLINFADAEQDQRVKLPVSELAQPPEQVYDQPLTIQFTGDGLILFAGDELASMEQLQSALLRETQIIQAYDDKNVADVTVIIRADETAQTGKVEEIIQACQKFNFEKFVLRSRQGTLPRSSGDG